MATSFGIARIRQFVRHRRMRRVAYGISALILAVLCLWPEPYVARAKLLPQDSSSAGLGQILNSLGGQFSNFSNLLTGGRPPNDLYLIIGRSDKTLDGVIALLRLVGPGRPYVTEQAAKLDLNKKVDVHLLVGGVIEVVTRSHDPAEADRLTRGFVQAISANVAALTRQTVVSKRQIVQQRFGEARDQVSVAGARLEAFRRANRLADAEIQLGAAISLRTGLQAQLQAKLVELRNTQQFAGPENPQLIAVQNEVASLRAQIASTGEPSIGSAGPNVSGLTEINNQYLNLYRDYRFAQALYDVYSRASEQIAVEELVAAGATYIQLVEPSHIDPERHYNIPAVALLVVLGLLVAFTELYVPATGLRWRNLLTDDIGEPVGG